MKQLFSFALIAILLISTTPVTSAQQQKDPEDVVETKLEEDLWHIDTVAKVKGRNLRGPNPGASKVCFTPQADNEDLRCFTANHTNIQIWTDYHLEFVPPKNTPPLGTLYLLHPYNKVECEYLYNTRTCKNVTVNEKVFVSDFIAHPYISTITKKGSDEAVHVLEAGETYEIKGYRFGESGWGIYLGADMIDKPDIDVWSNGLIIFTPSRDYISELSEYEESAIQVHNAAAKSNSWSVRLPDEEPTGTEEETASGTSVLANTEAQAEQQASSSSSSSSKVNLPFSDVPADHPYFQAIQWGYESGFLQGYPDGTFRPARGVSRAELLKIILGDDPRVEALHQSTSRPFSDMDPNAWYTPYLRYSVQVGAIQGYPDGTFRPGKTVNVAEALKIAYRFFELPTRDPKGREWYARYLEDAKANDLLFSNDLEAGQPMSRQDVVWIVWKMLQLRHQ